MLQRLAYACVAFGFRWLGRLLWGVRVEGRENVPRKGPLLVAVTHESMLDPVIVGSELPRPLRYLARNTLFGPRGEIRLHGRVLLFAGAVPIEREGGGARDTIRVARDLLEQGDAVLIFPEGTRSPDGRVQRFRRGAGLIARAAGCPVLPVSIDGSRLLWQKGSRLPRLWGGPVRVRIGAPLTFDRTTTAEDLVARLRDVILDLRGTRDQDSAGDGAEDGASTGGGPSRGGAAGE